MSYISHLLESLERVAGLQSFFLVVNPYNSSDEGFLGGTTTGRDFWQGHRGCSTAGAQAFRLFAAHSAASGSTAPEPSVSGEPVATGSVTSNSGVASPVHHNVEVANARQKPHGKSPAITLKTEVYSKMRAAIRSVCGYVSNLLCHLF